MPPKTLDLTQSMRLAENYDIKFAPYRIIHAEKELASACRKIGFPIAIKVNSQKILHKTEAGGVQINIRSLAQARKVFREMKRLRGFESVIVQKMLKGREIIIGGKRDVQFGPTVLFGLGGIFVEVFRDYSIGICPVSKKRAREMVRSIKAYPVLTGQRGQKPVNIEVVVDSILKASRLMTKEKRIEELDLNPLIATQREVVAVDARVILSGE